MCVKFHIDQNCQFRVILLSNLWNACKSKKKKEILPSYNLIKIFSFNFFVFIPTLIYATLSRDKILHSAVKGERLKESVPFYSERFPNVLSVYDGWILAWPCTEMHLERIRDRISLLLRARREISRDFAREYKIRSANRSNSRANKVIW